MLKARMGPRFLAFDLGAESGRAMSAELRAGVLDLSEVCRFANDAVRVDGSLYWDAARLWLHMEQALTQAGDGAVRYESIGVDAWGCDYGLLAENGELLGNPYHYRDSRTDGVLEEVVTRVPPARIYEVTGIQLP